MRNTNEVNASDEMVWGVADTRPPVRIPGEYLRKNPGRNEVLVSLDGTELDQPVDDRSFVRPNPENV